VINRIWSFIKDIVSRFIEDDILSAGAQATFYMLLSLFPFLIFVITLVSYTPILDFKDNAEIFATLMPKNAYTIVTDIIEQTVNSRSSTLLSFGMIFTLWSSSSGVSALIRGINRAYDQEEKRPYWRLVGLSLYFTLELVAVIFLSLILIVFGRIMGSHFFVFLGFSDLFVSIWNSVRNIIAYIAIIVVFISLYRKAPNRKIRFKEAIPGAIFASVAWVFISLGFSYYANNLGNYTKVYGSLGGIIVLMMWIYLSIIMILIGAEINASRIYSKYGQIKEKIKKF